MALVRPTKFIYEATADDAKSTKRKGVAVWHVKHCSGPCHLNPTVRESYCMFGENHRFRAVNGHNNNNVIEPDGKLHRAK
jgi:hypothetical protein